MAGSLIIRYNKWYGKFRVNGVQKLRSLGIDAKGGRNKRKAQEALDELVRQYSGLKIDKDNVYLFDFFAIREWITTNSCYTLRDSNTSKIRAS